MGRSKFPGKPSKHVNRKRVNVLPYTVLPNTDNENSQQFNSGIYVANNLHSSTEQVNICEQRCIISYKIRVDIFTTAVFMICR